MKKNFKLWLIKLLFFTMALVIAVIISETVLSTIAKKYQLAQYYNPDTGLDPSVMAPLNLKFNNNRYEDTYEIYKAHKNNLEVITIGDSYTNGGNVLWNQTYPFQLFLKLGKKIPVSNMGVCEDTTKGSYLRLQDYFAKNKSNTKNRIVVVLVGAADMFYDSGPAFESLYNEFINGGHISSAEINLKIEEKPEQWYNLKTIKMAKYVYSWSRDKLSVMLSSSIKKDPLSTDLAECFLAVDPTRRTCFTSKYIQISNDINAKIDSPFFKTLTNVIIFNNSLRQSGKEEKIVEDLLTAIDVFPKMLGTPEVIYNIASFSTLQSKYSLKEDILPRIKQSFNLNSKLFQKDLRPGQDRLTQSDAILEALENWTTNYDRASIAQKTHYQKMIELVHQNGGNIIFLTYPLDYKNTNSDILKLAEKKNVHVIDITKLFSDLNAQGLTQEQLIGDWEHCTPLGYEYIATSVSEKINEILLNATE